MINSILIIFVKCLIWLRYRVRVKGLESIKRSDSEGILFLPNHPALIEPVILMTWLYGAFKARALADRNQIDRFFIRNLAQRFGVLPVSDISKNGISSASQIREAITRCTESLGHGENLIIYPAGRIYRDYREDLGANSAVERILKTLPDVRIVLVRTTGLWGSSFSWASGKEPSLGVVLKKAVKALLLNGLFFSPRREVTIELTEPASEFPRTQNRAEINRYLETFYNQNVQHNLYVPYTIWERGETRTLPEARQSAITGDSSQTPPETRKIVTEFIADLTGTSSFDDATRLSHGLGMDSLARADLAAWLQSEFGFTHDDPDALNSVGDVMLAAAGQAVIQTHTALKPISPKWFKHDAPPLFPENLSKMTLLEAFLFQARRTPDRAIIADQTSGVKTYRELILASMVLQKHIAALPGDHLGVMMPASVGAVILYLATLFAGKTPVMVNWTLGSRNIQSSLDSVDVTHILTARALLTRLAAQNIDLTEIEDRFVCLEDIGQSLSRREKLTALVLSRLSWKRLTAVTPPATAAILFTSGSESQPKAVPLTHQNILTNIADIEPCATFTESDSLLGILPPFHSFGLTISVLFPLTTGIPAVYYPNPTDGRTLARTIGAYEVSIMVGTPTFLNGIVRSSQVGELDSLRMVVSGAEKCPDALYKTLERQCPQTVVLEGYGVTECSPVISVNRQNDHHPGTIGRVMDSIEHVIVHPETNEPVPTGQKGMLLVRGNSIFKGYLNRDAASPFVQYNGLQWYRTGDLVRQDERGIITFEGRLKRFVKRGGEMISLPAIEAVLSQCYPADDDSGPNLAIVPGPENHEADLVLLTTCDLDRETVNATIRNAGLSGLHNIRQVVKIDSIPLLGTGKIDYRALSRKIVSE